MIKYKTLFILILILLVFLIIPILYVGNYAVPQGDDFGFSSDVRHCYEAGGSEGSMLVAAAQRARETYFSWQGSFSAIFLMALQPGVFGFKYYTAATYLLVFSLLGAILYLCDRVYRGIFGINRYVTYIIAICCSILCTQFLPLAYQSFYWYNGSVYYTFFFSLSLISYGLSLDFVQRGKSWKIVLVILLNAFIGGGNYITALVTAIVSALFIIYLAFSKNKKWKHFIAPLVAVCVSLIISMTAPGNAAREASDANVSWILGTFKVAFEYALSYLKNWFNLPLIAVTVFLLPLMVKESESCKKEFRYPLGILFLSLCIFVAMFMPTVYALRQPGSSRLFNIYYFAFVIMFIFDVFYLIGWLRRKINVAHSSKIKLSVVASASAVAAVLVFLSVFRYGSTMTSLMAVGEIRSGEAQGFYAEMLEREEIYEDDSIKNVTLKPLENTPYLLFSEDLKEDSDNFMNEDAATYFEKESIVIG